MNHFRAVIICLSAVYRLNKIKISRTITDFFGDRIRQAASKPDLISFFQRLIELMDIDIGYIKKAVYTDYLAAAQSDYKSAILKWIRNNPAIASMLCSIKEESELDDILPEINIDTDIDEGHALPMGKSDIEIEVTCLSQLSHGDDVKSGNATLFRRMMVLTDKQQTRELPYYAGNALRGQLRDLLADNMLQALDIKIDRINPMLSLWFFHLLYSGGSLSESTKEEIALLKELGNQTIKTAGINSVRNYFPHLSILGFAIGNKVLPGRIYVNDLRPICAEWGFENSASIDTMLSWFYFTRREDLEKSDDTIKNESMIVNTECLISGTRLMGGINVSPHATEIERSAIFYGLELLKRQGAIGASNRQGYGNVAINYTTNIDYDPKLYPTYLEENKDSIIAFMHNIRAIAPVDHKSTPDDGINF